MTNTRGGSLVAFFLLTYAVMWTLYFTVVAASIPASTPPGMLLILLGAYSPGIVALALTVRTDVSTWTYLSGPGRRDDRRTS